MPAEKSKNDVTARMRIDNWVPTHNGDRKKFRAVCFHEAAHAKIGHVLGLPTERVGAWATAGNADLRTGFILVDVIGECQWVRPDVYTDAHLHAKLIACLAGPAQSAMSSGSHSGERCTNDERMALATAALIVDDADAPAYVEEHRALAIALVFTHRAEIAALATRLESEGTILYPFG